MRGLTPESVIHLTPNVWTQPFWDALRDRKFEVKVPAEVAARARMPIERMVAIG